MHLTDYVGDCPVSSVTVTGGACHTQSVGNVFISKEIFNILCLKIMYNAQTHCFLLSEHYSMYGWSTLLSDPFPFIPNIFWVGGGCFDRLVNILCINVKSYCTPYDFPTIRALEIDSDAYSQIHRFFLHVQWLNTQHTLNIAGLLSSDWGHNRAIRNTITSVGYYKCKLNFIQALFTLAFWGSTTKVINRSGSCSVSVHTRIFRRLITHACMNK